MREERLLRKVDFYEHRYSMVFLCVLSFLSCRNLCLGGCRPWEVFPRFSYEVSHRMHFKSCLATSWVPKYKHICKTHVFAEVVLGDNHGGKEC